MSWFSVTKTLSFLFSRTLTWNLVKASNFYDFVGSVARLGCGGTVGLTREINNGARQAKADSSSAAFLRPCQLSPNRTKSEPFTKIRLKILDIKNYKILLQIFLWLPRNILKLLTLFKAASILIRNFFNPKFF